MQTTTIISRHSSKKAAMNACKKARSEGIFACVMAASDAAKVLGIVAQSAWIVYV